MRAEPLSVAVGIDDDQRAALEFAASEALGAGTPLRIVHAYVVPPSAMGSVYGVDVPESFRAGGQEVLDRAVGQLTVTHPDLVIEPALFRGFAPAVLETESADARLLVIGPDASKPWFLRMFEGRVAHRLVEHAACPVVVVPDTWTPAHDASAVIVLIDRETGAHGPLAFAFEAAARRGVELQIVHVVADSHPAHEAELDPQWQSVRRIADSWFESHPAVRGGARLVRGDLRAESLDIAGSAGLLVLGRPLDRHLADLAMDSLAQSLVAAAGCPVAVVPAGYRSSPSSRG